LRDQVDHRLIVIDDQDPSLPALEGIRRDAVLLHEPVERVARDPAESRAGDPEALELARVEAADDRLLAHFTYLSRLTRWENGLHGRAGPILQDRGQSSLPHPFGYNWKETTPDRPPCLPSSRRTLHGGQCGSPCRVARTSLSVPRYC